jgi:hypothetical protein
MDSTAEAAALPVVLVTNDDGIDAPGLRFLVDQLVASRRFRVLVSAPDTSVFRTPCRFAISPLSCSFPSFQFPCFLPRLVGLFVAPCTRMM